MNSAAEEPRYDLSWFPAAIAAYTMSIFNYWSIETEFFFQNHLDARYTIFAVWLRHTDYADIKSPSIAL